MQSARRLAETQAAVLAPGAADWDCEGVQNPPRLPISLVVIAQDEEDRLADCLRSADFCAESLVLDGGSRDRTVELARSLGARVEVRAFDGHVRQKSAALEHATQDWVLSLDADERVSPALRAEILALFSRGEPPCAGYSVPRLTWHLGRWIRGGGWYPDRKLRLFRRVGARCGGVDPHDRFFVEGRVGALRGDLLHFTYRDLAHHLQKMDSYTTIAAERLHAAGRGWALTQMLLRPPHAFLRAWLFQAGFRDGRVGFKLATLDARYQWLRFSKLRRLRRASHSRPS